MKRIWNLLLGYPECVLIVVVLVNALGWGVASKVRAQAIPAGANVLSYSGQECASTSNPPIAGRLVDGICVQIGESTSSGYPIRYNDIITIVTVPHNCPAGTEKVLVPGGVKCARGLVDPE